MSNDKNIKKLFNISGCLTTNTMLKFLKKKLSTTEQSIVEGHLNSCELCADAMEGFALTEDRASILPALDTINDKITELTGQSSNQKSTGKKRAGALWIYGSVAASLVLLIGLYFVLIQSNRQSSTEMAMMADTLIEQKIAPVENDTPEIEETTQEPNEESSMIRDVPSGQMEMVIGGVKIDEAKKQLEEKAVTEPLEYDDDEIAESDIPEINEEIGDVTLSNIAMDMEQTDDASTFVGGVMLEKEEVVFEDIELELPEASINEEIVATTSGAARGKKPQKAKKDQKSRKNAAIDNSNDLLTTSYTMQLDDADDTTIIMYAEQPPEYPGGSKALNKFIRNNLEYPNQALDNNIEGKVYLQFTVETDGTLSDIVILRSLNYGCDEEAIRLIKLMPPWDPGKHRGLPVRTSFTLPVEFELKK